MLSRITRTLRSLAPLPAWWIVSRQMDGGAGPLLDGGCGRPGAPRPAGAAGRPPGDTDHPGGTLRSASLRRERVSGPQERLDARSVARAWLPRPRLRGARHGRADSQRELALAGLAAPARHRHVAGGAPALLPPPRRRG